jgi:hypothetical protein
LAADGVPSLPQSPRHVQRSTDQSTRVRRITEMCGINAFGIAVIPKGLFSGVEQSTCLPALTAKSKRIVT